MLREDAELFDRYEGAKRPERDPHDPSGQGKVFNELFMPYTIAPNIGVIVGGRGAPHHGRWTFGANDEIIERPEWAAGERPAFIDIQAAHDARKKHIPILG